jgi:hypothetical protein
MCAPSRQQYTCDAVVVVVVHPVMTLLLCKQQLWHTRDWSMQLSTVGLSSQEDPISKASIDNMYCTSLKYNESAITASDTNGGARFFVRRERMRLSVPCVEATNTRYVPMCQSDNTTATVATQ